MTDPDPAVPTGSTSTPAPDLAERYGRARTGSRKPGGTSGLPGQEDPWEEGDDVRPRPKLSVGARIAVAVALAAGVAIAAWFTIADTQRDPSTFTDVGFSVESPRRSR